MNNEIVGLSEIFNVGFMSIYFVFTKFRDNLFLFNQFSTFINSLLTFLFRVSDFFSLKIKTVSSAYKRVSKCNALGKLLM